MNREFLKGLGLDDAAIDKVMAEHGKTVETHKSKTTDLQTSLDDLKGQLTQRDKDLTELKGKAKGSEDLQKQLTDLQGKYDTEKADYETKLKDTQLSSALKLALAGKVHDADMTLGQIDKSKIQLDTDGNVTGGLDEQIKTLQETKSFLFVLDSDGKPVVKGAKPAEGAPPAVDPKAGDYGKNLAESLAKNNEGLDAARKSYFE